jgi:hypothetical protein
VRDDASGGRPTPQNTVPEKVCRTDIGVIRTRDCLGNQNLPQPSQCASRSVSRGLAWRRSSIPVLGLGLAQMASAEDIVTDRVCLVHNARSFGSRMWASGAARYDLVGAVDGRRPCRSELRAPHAA